MPGTISQASSRIQDYLYQNEHEKSIGEGVKNMAHFSCAKIPEVLIISSKAFLPFMVDGTGIIIVKFRKRSHLILGSDSEVEREIKAIPIRRPKLNRRALVSTLSTRLDAFLISLMDDEYEAPFKSRSNALTEREIFRPKDGDVSGLRSLIDRICMSRDHYFSNFTRIRDKALDLKAYLVRPDSDDAIIIAAWGLLQIRDVMTS